MYLLSFVLNTLIAVFITIKVINFKIKVRITYVLIVVVLSLSISFFIFFILSIIEIQQSIVNRLITSLLILIILVGLNLKKENITYHYFRLSPKDQIVIFSGLSLSYGVIFLNQLASNVFGSKAIDQVHQDLLFLNGMSFGLSTLGSKTSLFADGTELKYHYFGYLFIGDLRNIVEVAGIGGLTTITIIYQYIVGTLFVLALVSIAKEFKFDFLSELLTVIFGILSGYVLLENGSHLNFDSPSQSLSAFFLLVYVVILCKVPGLEVLHTFKGTFLLSLLIFSLTGIKGSAGAIAVIATSSLLLVSKVLFRRKLIIFASIVIGFLLSYFFIVQGDNQSAQGIELFSSKNNIAALNQFHSHENIFIVIAANILVIILIFAKFLPVIFISHRNKVLLKEYLELLPLLYVFIIFIVLFASDNAGNHINLLWFGTAASVIITPIASVGVSDIIKNIFTKTNITKSTKIIYLLAIFILFYLVVILSVRNLRGIDKSAIGWIILGITLIFSLVLMYVLNLSKKKHFIVAASIFVLLLATLTIGSRLVINPMIHNYQINEVIQKENRASSQNQNEAAEFLRSVSDISKALIVSNDVNSFLIPNISERVHVVAYSSTFQDFVGEKNSNIVQSRSRRVVDFFNGKITLSQVVGYRDLDNIIIYIWHNDKIGVFSGTKEDFILIFQNADISIYEYRR